jgi:hypothetical protein
VHEGGIGGDAAGGQRLQVAIAAADGEIHEFKAVDKADAAVAEVEQEFGGAQKGAAVVHIEPAVGRGGAGGAAMDDEGQADFGEHGDARVIHAGGVNDQAID